VDWASHLLPRWPGKPRCGHLGIEHGFTACGTSTTVKLAKTRVRMGIKGAYGEKAEQLGLGKRTPPSRGDRGVPAA
jgi:hypothetical protein